jgi:hypothetical protein
MVLGIIRNARKSLMGGGRDIGAGQLSPQTLELSNFTSGNVALAVGKENIVGEFSILPQTRHYFGYGNPQFSDNQGTIFVDLKDTAGTPADIDGEVVLSVQDYNGNNNRVVYRGLLADLRSGETDITKQVKFPLKDVFGLENDKLVMKLIPSNVGNGTLNATASKARIASSVQYLGRI